MDEDVGQGKLYSPGNAVQVGKKKKKKSSSSSSHEGEEEVDEELENRQSPRPGIRRIKDKFLERLSGTAHVDALDNARQFLDTVVRDFSHAAHALTIDALSRIKSHLSDFLPSLSPALANKMVEDAEELAAKEEEAAQKGGQQQQQQQQEEQERISVSTTAGSSSSSFMFPTSSLFASLVRVKPRSRL